MEPTKQSLEFKKIFQNQKKLLAVIGLIALVAVAGEILVSNFISVSQLFSTMRFASFIAFFGLCQMIVVAGGGNAIDLSVGYIATLASIFGVKVMEGSNGRLWLAIIVAIALGAFFGAINGVLVAYVNLSPLVVTMAMASIVEGIVNVYAAGVSISGSPSPILLSLATKTTFGFPNIVILLIVLAVIVYFVMRKTKYGAILFGVGQNKVTAYLCGANVRLIRCLTYIASGTIAGLTGLVLAGNMGVAYKDMASFYVLPSYAAVVVGGISLSGGEGDYIMIVLGAVFLQALTNLFVALGGGDAVKWMGYGTVLYILLVLYASNRRKK